MKPNDKAYQEAADEIRFNSGLDLSEDVCSELAKLAVDAAYAAQFQSEEYAGLIEELRDGIIEHRRRFAGDTHDDLGGTADYEKTHAMTNRAADAIEALLAERDAEREQYEKLLSERTARHMQQMKAAKAIRDALAARLALVEDDALVERDDFAEQIALRSENGISKDLQEFLRKFKEDDSAAIRMFAQYRDLEIEMDSWKSLWEKTNAHMRQVEAERDALAARLAPVDDEALVEIAASAIRRNKFERTGRLDCFDPSNLTPEELGEGRAAIAAIRPHIEAAEREQCVKAVEKVAERINVAHHERSEWEDGYLQGVHDAAAAIRRGE